MIRLSRPSIDERAIAEVAEVLRSGMLVSGARVAAFERALAERCERAHAVCVSSGTSALELSLVALGIGPGDEVLCPALTWPSPAHAIRLRGAIPVLVDVDPGEWNPLPAGFAQARTPRTRAAVVIDQFGFPARHAAIAAALPGLPVVEDAACAIGARADGRAAGAFGRIACLSFHPRKVVTTGEGGACLVDDPALAARLRALRDHGQEAPGRFLEAAGNHRMTEMAAVLGAAQLARLDAMVAHRRALAARYLARLSHLRPQRPAPGAEPNYQTFGIVLPEEGRPRDEVLAALRARGVEAGRLSYALGALSSVGARGAACAVAEELAGRGLALPLHEGLTDGDVDRVADALEATLAAPAGTESGRGPSGGGLRGGTGGAR